jgi:hypothetical protein
VTLALFWGVLYLKLVDDLSTMGMAGNILLNLAEQKVIACS